MIKTYEIPGLGHGVKVDAAYDYESDKCLCPVCGGLGMPWCGWFCCEDCPARSVIETGETFMPHGKNWLESTAGEA